jgi:hypothetical protein
VVQCGGNDVPIRRPFWSWSEVSPWAAAGAPFDPIEEGRQSGCRSCGVTGPKHIRRRVLLWPHDDEGAIILASKWAAPWLEAADRNQINPDADDLERTRRRRKRVFSNTSSKSAAGREAYSPLEVRPSSTKGVEGSTVAGRVMRASLVTRVRAARPMWGRASRCHRSSARRT